MIQPMVPKEGELYKTVTVAGHSFDLRYGYYEEHERALCPPVVVFPDLTKNPCFCPEGQPLVTQIQDACDHYQSREDESDNWCGDCIHFHSEHKEIGICKSPNMRRK